MKGKWAAGISPRNFTWVIRDRLAISERPGGFAPSHRRVRRREEIIWLRVQGFTQVISLLPSPHNLQAYEEQELACMHFPLPPSTDPSAALVDLFRHVQLCLATGHRLLIHQEELGDRVVGVVAGFLLWSGRLTSSPQAVAAGEHLVSRQMGPSGRELVAIADRLARDPATGPGSVAAPAGSPVDGTVTAEASESAGDNSGESKKDVPDAGAEMGTATDGG